VKVELQAEAQDGAFAFVCFLFFLPAFSANRATPQSALSTFYFLWFYFLGRGEAAPCGEHPIFHIVGQRDASM
jgi:hypothetical protein